MKITELFEKLLSQLSRMKTSKQNEIVHFIHKIKGDPVKELKKGLLYNHQVPGKQGE